jgi:hypothetical protein
MKRRKVPKYKVGDTVVITMYGTVGKVTDNIILILVDILHNKGVVNTKCLWLQFIYDCQETKNN